jgi:hypothetical protein
VAGGRSIFLSGTGEPALQTHDTGAGRGERVADEDQIDLVEALKAGSGSRFLGKQERWTQT